MRPLWRLNLNRYQGFPQNMPVLFPFILQILMSNWVQEPSTVLILFFCVYVCDASFSRSADAVWCEPLHHLLLPGPGWDGEAGGTGGSGLYSHLLRLVSGSGLALLRPGAPRWRTAARRCPDGQAAAQQFRHGLTEAPTVDPAHSGWGLIRMRCCHAVLPLSKVTSNSRTESGLWQNTKVELKMWSGGLLWVRFDQLHPLVVRIEVAPHIHCQCTWPCWLSYCTSVICAKLNWRAYNLRSSYNTSNLSIYFYFHNISYKHL